MCTEGAGGESKNDLYKKPMAIITMTSVYKTLNVHPNMDMSKVLNEDSFEIGGHEMTLVTAPGNLGINYILCIKRTFKPYQ